jgi:hypothetical protein
MINMAFEQKNIELGRRCLGLIRDIAERGATSWDAEQVGYALQELSQVLFERLGCEDRVFEPVSAGHLTELAHLHEELLWVDGFSRQMFRPQ